MPFIGLVDETTIPEVSVCALPTLPQREQTPSKKTKEPHMNGEYEEGRKINKRVVDTVC